MGHTSIAFLLCVEPGPLEPKARLLVESLRQWSGLPGAAVFAYQPRGGEPLSRETRTCFQRFGVEYRVGHFNKNDAENPWANKIHSCAHLAEATSCEIIAFLDTDTVVLNEPAELFLDESSDFAARPVVKKHAGTTGRRSDAHQPWWQRLYEAARVAPPGYVRTVEDGLRIRAYYNGGLIAFRASTGFAQRWVRMAGIAKPLIPADRYYNLDQISLALAAAAAPGRCAVLSARYNYPIARRAALPGPVLALHELVHVHYHHAFNSDGFLSSVKPMFDQSDERFRWLQARLPLEPVSPLAALKSYRRAPIRRALKKWRDEARMGVTDLVMRVRAPLSPDR